MKSIFENMSKLADDIVLGEQDAKKLYDSYHKRVENQKRKAAFMRKCIWKKKKRCWGKAMF